MTPSWIYFLHAPRKNFAETMSEEEQQIMGLHAQHLQKLLDEGTLIIGGPTLGEVNTGIAIFDAPDEQAARDILAADPAVSSGLLEGELRPYLAGFLRGR